MASGRFSSAAQNLRVALQLGRVDVEDRLGRARERGAGRIALGGGRHAARAAVPTEQAPARRIVRQPRREHHRAVLPLVELVDQLGRGHDPADQLLLVGGQPRQIGAHQRRAALVEVPADELLPPRVGPGGRRRLRGVDDLAVGGLERGRQLAAGDPGALGRVEQERRDLGGSTRWSPLSSAIQ